MVNDRFFLNKNNCMRCRKILIQKLNNVFMLLLLITVLFEFSSKYVAEKFREDYVWSSEFLAFYRLHDLATTWAQARSMCEAEGASLLVPTSLNEMENIKIFLSNMKPQHRGIFIGVHAQFSKEDFVTLRGVPIAGTILDLMWGDGQPDLDEDSICVIMDREGLFDDQSCKKIYPFICKIDMSNVTYNENCNNFDTAYTLGTWHHGKCYKLHTEPQTWHDAYLTCKREQGQLVILNSAEEASYITTFIEENHNNNGPNPDIFYAGFSDLMYPFHYRTITGVRLDKAGYAVWDITEKGNFTLNLKRCGAITRTGFLVTTYCDRPGLFLCETSAPPQKRRLIQDGYGSSAN